MHARPTAQLGLMKSLVSVPANDFLDRLDQLVDWRLLETALHALCPATTGSPPHPPLGLFKMSLLKHCSDRSDLQSRQPVLDRKEQLTALEPKTEKP